MLKKADIFIADLEDNTVVLEANNLFKGTKISTGFLLVNLEILTFGTTRKEKGIIFQTSTICKAALINKSFDVCPFCSFCFVFWRSV